MQLVVVCRTNVYSPFETRQDAEDFVGRHCAAYGAQTTRGVVCAAGWTYGQHKIAEPVSPGTGLNQRTA